MSARSLLGRICRGTTESLLTRPCQQARGTGETPPLPTLAPTPAHRRCHGRHSHRGGSGNGATVDGGEVPASEGGQTPRRGEVVPEACAHSSRHRGCTREESSTAQRRKNSRFVEERVRSSLWESSG